MGTIIPTSPRDVPSALRNVPGTLRGIPATLRAIPAVGSGYQAPAWLPLNLAVLFDPTSGVSLSGSNVTAMSDFSGNANNVVAMATAPAFTASSVNGQPGITFTGATNQGLTNGSVTLTTNNHARSFVCVCKPGSTLPQMVFDWRGGANNFYQALGFSGTLFIYGNSTSNATSGGSITSGAPLLVEWYSDGVNVSQNRNGVAQTITNSTVAGGDTGPAGFFLGNYYAGLLAFIGDINLAFGANRVFTSTEINGFREGVQQRFAISLSIATLTLSADSLTVAPSGNQTFTAAGGSGSYTYSLGTNNSGGSINSSSGAYTAGSVANTIDVVTVTDSAGFTASLNVSVTSTTTTTHITSGKRILMLGDSTTNLANGTAWWGTAFPASVNGALSPGSATFIDGGHVGAQSADINTNFASWVTANTPDIVYLTIGVNDVNNSVDPNTFASNVTTTIGRILAGTATKIAVTGIPCYGEIWSAGPIWGVNSPNFDAVIDRFNSILESIVNGLRNPNVIFINFRKQLLTWEVTNNPTKLAQGVATVDKIHPNSTGMTTESGFAFSQVTAP